MSKESICAGTVMFCRIICVAGLLKITVEGLIGFVVFDTGIVKGLVPVPDVPVDVPVLDVPVDVPVPDVPVDVPLPDVPVDVPVPDVPVDVPVPDVPVGVPLPDGPDDVPLLDGPVYVPVEVPEDEGVVVVVATPFLISTVVTVVGWVLPVPGTALNQMVKTNLPETIEVL